MAVRDETITLPDGRTLAYTEIGSTQRRAPTLVYLHGAPTSRLDLVGCDAALEALGVRVLSPDRPGYGRSTPHAERAMTDHAADVAVLADRLGADRFAVIGLSSGGPYALATASTLGNRVLAAAVVAGVTDFGWEGAWHDYLDDEIEIMRQPDLDAALRWCAARYGDDGLGFLDGRARPAASPEPAGDGGGLLSSIVESFRQGVAGYAHDVWLQGRPWAFDIARITAPVRVFHGRDDGVVPLAHAHHTAEVVPAATLDVWEGVPHRAAIERVPDVARTLLA